jgi:hypothetical protein
MQIAKSPHAKIGTGAFLLRKTPNDIFISVYIINAY